MKIKNFTETDVEFDHITRLYNLVSHDDKEHVDDMKEGWAVIGVQAVQPLQCRRQQISPAVTGPKISTRLKAGMLWR